MRATLLVALCLSWPAIAWGKDFYVDPATGSPTGDGSVTKPWRTIEEVIAANLVSTQNWASLPYTSTSTLVAKNPTGPIKAGDTIYLRSGYHGALSIIGHYNAKTVTITAQAGQTPKLKSVLVRSSSNWTLRGLSVSPEYAPTYNNATMIAIESHNHSGPVEKITVEDCSLRSVADATKWTAADWDQKSANGIAAGGKEITLRRNQLKNVNFGISVTATNSLVEKNVVDSFAGDGLRGLGNYTTFEYNTVKNCYDVNANHDDGFQSWSTGPGGVGTGTVTGVVLRGNTIINYEDPNQPHRGTLQGIGMFDGTFVDWVIENNVIITDHWHGITLLGAKNCRVVNNTVIDLNNTTPGPPWIQIGAHKDGTAPTGCTVRNNLTTKLNNAATGVTEDHNITVSMTALATHFVNAPAFDLHLKPTSTAIDKGSATLAPAIDIEGTPRPQGAGIDVGAYEWSKTAPKLDGGVKSDATLKPDGSLAPDGSAAPGDGTKPAGDHALAGDGGGWPLGDGASANDRGPSPDGGAAAGSDGCSCGLATRRGPGDGLPIFALGFALALALLARRRRR